MSSSSSLLFFATAVTVVFLLFSSARAHLFDLPPLASPSPTSSRSSLPGVCFVIRTYRKHGVDGEGEGNSSSSSPLARLLRSLSKQSNRNWRALLLVADEDPFLELEEIVERAFGNKEEEAEENKVWVFGRFSGPEHRAREEGEGQKERWSPNYHRRLFSLTDEAVHFGCPANSELVVVTNGDNSYAPRFVERALKEAKGGGRRGGNDESETSKNMKKASPFSSPAAAAAESGKTGAKRGSGNGDNEAEKKKSVSSTSSSRKKRNGKLLSSFPPADLILFDYASRYTSPAGVPCERFAVTVDGEKSKNRSENDDIDITTDTSIRCKRNFGRWCHTDLGAVAFRLSRLRGWKADDELSGEEERTKRRRRSEKAAAPPLLRFAGPETLAAASSSSDDTLDGVFVEMLSKKESEWRVRRVKVGAEGTEDDPWRRRRSDENETTSPSHGCWFDHSPSPHACALSGKIWDDSVVASGGECVSEVEAEKRMKTSTSRLDVISVRVLPGKQAPMLRCLRWRDRKAHGEAMRRFFGKRCEDDDEGDLLEF